MKITTYSILLFWLSCNNLFCINQWPLLFDEKTKTGMAIDINNNDNKLTDEEINQLGKDLLISRYCWYWNKDNDVANGQIMNVSKDNHMTLICEYDKSQNEEGVSPVPDINKYKTIKIED